MRFHVDMSLYSSPTEPYGNVTGFVELESLPSVGEMFHLIGNSETGSALSLRIEAVSDAGEGEASGSIALEDYVVEGHELAERLGERLDKETKFHVYVY